MCRLFLASLLALASPLVMADQLTLQRIFADAGLDGDVPHQVELSPDGRRVAYIQASDGHPHRHDLWLQDTKTGKARLLVDAASLTGGEENLSREELARRERSRTAGMHGIVQFQWSKDSQRLLFPLDGKIYLYDLAAEPDQALDKLDTGIGPVLDPKLSPAGGYVSWVRDQDLWVLDLDSGERRQLTLDGRGTVHNAQAEFVAQEEMDRHTGYWWAPDDSAIAYEQYDAAEVPVTRRFEIYADHTAVVKQRYPFAGDPNVRVRLGLISPEGGETRWVDLGKNGDMYLVRVRWLPDSKRLSYQWMSRNQKKLQLRLVDSGTLEQRVLLTESSETWIDLHHDLRFLSEQGAFIWASDRSGFNHLYLYGMDGKLKHALSAGAWNLDRLVAVDEDQGLVYVASNRDFVPDRQLYALKLDGSTAEQPQRISKRDGVHHFQFDAEAEMYVDSFSSPSTPPQVSLHGANGGFVAWVAQNKLAAGHPYWPYHDAHIVPEFGTIAAADGQTLYYRIYKPAGFDPNKQYPVFNSFYGGPHGQVVTRGWGDYFAQYMAQQGYVVFSLDNRGMARRGRAFSDVIQGQLGAAEVADQVAGIHWLQSQPWVDDKRIGLFGWSYGGYMTLMLLAKDSVDIAAGVAVAPVTDWHLYDTFYTERYLGQPDTSLAAYKRSSPFAWLDGFKSPLLLVHGMADDNVLFLNSTKLMAELQRRNIGFELMTYPGGKHGLNLPGQRLHLYQLIADFFERKVKGKCGAGDTAAEGASTGAPAADSPG